VGERRARPIIMVPRGASAMAPESSLEDYAAAMDYGAARCEVDLRRTRDGVLVLFHDDTLYRLLDDLGEVSELAPPQFEDATRALLCQDLTLEELKALLTYPNSAVRGTAILYQL
jgi:glycerophosphoryl diester phosphodiesterase